MRVIISETGKAERLYLVDPTTREEVTELFISQCPIELSKHQIIRLGERSFHCRQADFEWWRQLILEYQSVYTQIEVLEMIHGLKAVQEAIEGCTIISAENRPAFIRLALQEHFCDSPGVEVITPSHEYSLT